LSTKPREEIAALGVLSPYLQTRAINHRELVVIHETMASKKAGERWNFVDGTAEWEGFTFRFDLHVRKDVSELAKRAATCIRYELIPISSIQRTQARREKEIVDRIKKDLVEGKRLDAITVVTTKEEPGVYKLEEGHHRTEACKALGFTAIPANVLVIDKGAFDSYVTVPHPFFS
jgi:hypothetical protein